MRRNPVVKASIFIDAIKSLVPKSKIRTAIESCGVRRRCPPKVKWSDIVNGLIYHTVTEEGTLAEHMKQLTGKSITDGALSQRRANLPCEVFEELMDSALKPKADPARHPTCFHHGVRLCGVDGSLFSMSNTPQVKKQMPKARTRRGTAAFAKVGAVVLLELGLHNPLAATLGAKGESEMALARRVLRSSLKRACSWGTAILKCPRCWWDCQRVRIANFWCV